MVSKKEKIICEKFQFFDRFGYLPSKKIRIDVTISHEALKRLGNLNRSKVIDSLILEKFKSN